MKHMDLSRLDPWMDFCWLQLYTKTEEPVAATRWIRYIYVKALLYISTSNSHGTVLDRCWDSGTGNRTIIGKESNASQQFLVAPMSNPRLQTLPSFHCKCSTIGGLIPLQNSNNKLNHLQAMWGETSAQLVLCSGFADLLA